MDLTQQAAIRVDSPDLLPGMSPGAATPETAGRNDPAGRSDLRWRGRCPREPRGRVRVRRLARVLLERVSSDDRLVTRAELERYVKDFGAYHTGLLPSSVYHVDPDCVWGSRMKRKNLVGGFGKNRHLCRDCRQQPRK